MIMPKTEPNAKTKAVKTKSKKNTNPKPKPRKKAIIKPKQLTLYDRQMITLALVDKCKEKLDLMIDKAEYPNKINDISSALYRCDLIETAVFNHGNMANGEMEDDEKSENALISLISMALDLDAKNTIQKGEH